MESRFEKLARQRARAFSAAESEKILETMLPLGTFEELEKLHAATFSPAECTKILDAMLRVATYEQLESLLAKTFSPVDSEKIVNAMVAISQQHGEAARAAGSGALPRKQYDVFILHAAEDEEFAAPLALALKSKGLKVAFTDFVVQSGDWLQREIERGMAQSRYGVLILSQNFFYKLWPQTEQEGLATREHLSAKTLLGVLHEYDEKSVVSYSPTLADRIVLDSESGAEVAADVIYNRITGR
ncbi:MAG: toll/interleukin-1 receptor domain-containing protein [Dehalococcoidales bacterium]